MAINLTSCRIDHQPQVAKLLQRDVLFAIYAPHNTYILAPKNEKEKNDWILAFDRTHFEQNGSGDD